MKPHYDVVVLGCGPGGERAAIQAAKADKHVAVIEQAEVVGGNRVNWGTIPSKTLRESALFYLGLTRNQLHGIRVEIPDGITVADFTFRQRMVVDRELELINRSLDKYKVEVIHGRGRFLDPHTVAVHGDDGRLRTELTGDVMVIATGSRPHHPPDVPFDGERVFDSATILSVPRIPRSMLVLGAGVIGIEYASIFAALGVQVTLVDTRDRLLPYADREIVERLERELRRLGVVVLHQDRYETLERVDAPSPGVRCRTQAGNLLEAEVLLYCVGRDGNTDGIGLETLDITPTGYGLIEVNEHFQTRHPHIYAVGDVIGYPALASTAMEQGRRVVRHAFDVPGLPLRTDVLPMAVYAIPGISYIGDTEESLQARGVDYIVGRAHYDKNPRGQIIGDTGGMLKLLFDAESLSLLGVHIIGSSASELIHIGQAFMTGDATASQVAETLYNYPTLSDLYRHAAVRALAEHRRRVGRGAQP